MWLRTLAHLAKDLNEFDSRLGHIFIISGQIISFKPFIQNFCNKLYLSREAVEIICGCISSIFQNKINLNIMNLKLQYYYFLVYCTIY